MAMLFRPQLRNLAQDEQIILGLRRHPAILVGRLVPPFIVLLAPLTLSLWSLLNRTNDPIFYTAVIDTSVKIAAIVIVPLLFWAGMNVYDWGNDSFFVTNRRVIRVEQRYFVAQSRMEAFLSDIQNVAVLVPDALAHFLNYGSLIIETAAQDGRIEFDSIPNPFYAQAVIFQQRGLPLPRHEEGRPQPRTVHDYLLYILPLGPQRAANGDITWHKHWLILVENTIPGVALLIACALLLWWTHAWLFLAGLAAIVVWLVYRYVDWWNDIYIVTDNRIIDIERIPLLRDDRREAFLEQIQNVSLTVPNPLWRFFNLGNVHIETAGKAENFTFDAVPDPAAVQREIMDRLQAARTGRKKAEQEAHWRETEELVHRIVRRHYYPPPGEQGDEPPPSR